MKLIKYKKLSCVLHLRVLVGCYFAWLVVVAVAVVVAVEAEPELAEVVGIVPAEVAGRLRSCFVWAVWAPLAVVRRPQVEERSRRQLLWRHKPQWLPASLWQQLCSKH